MNEKNNTVKNPTQKRFFRKKQNKSEIPLAQASKELDRVKSQRASGSVKKTLQPRNETPQRKPQNTQQRRPRPAANRVKEPVRRTPVKIIPLGGLNEIGKNFTVIECSNDMFVIDCGLAFPDSEMPGVDIVIPDFSYVEKNQEKLRGVVLTHGHEDHIGGLDAVVTSKNTYIAPFVNAEECEYLVIEDAFPNGKPALDKGGIIFTDRATVDKVEKMKVCTCLNPLHTALAIYGCLLGYTLISEEMKNPLLKNMVEVIGYKEGLPVVVNPGILDPKKFIDEVVNVRIPNPFLPDSPQRIATDTSQKLSIRFGETIKAYEASPDLHTEDLKLIPLVYAGWLRYLMGIDDEGREFTPSSDPLLEEARQYVADYELSFSPKDLSKLDALLANEKIFGVNLHAIGMDTLVKQYFAELSSGVGAVAAALKKYVPEKVTL